MKKNFWLALLAFAVAGLSFAGPMMMPMDGGPGGNGGDMDSSAALPSFSGAGPGLPLTEVGIGLAILAAGYWWFEIRPRRKMPSFEGEEEEPPDAQE